MLVRDILRSKGDAAATITVSPTLSVLDAMRELVRHNIGAVVVHDGAICGILTERDVLRAGAEAPMRLLEEMVEDLMTRDVITATADAELHQVMEIMTSRRIRHLPIVAEGELAGMVSIGDVVNALRQTTEAENRYLHSYISGTAV
jgi:CBS domain-containing protein